MGALHGLPPVARIAVYTPSDAGTLRLHAFFGCDGFACLLKLVLKYP